MPAKHTNLHHVRKKASSLKNNFFNYLVYTVSIVEPSATLPQIYNIWIKKQTSGVSLLSWSGFCIAACIWFIYGIKRKDKAIILSSIAWLIAEGLIVLGLLLYQ